MQTTVDFLDALRTRLGVTDYALARHLGLTRSQISRYRNRHDALSDESAVRAAELLDLEPAYVLACVAAERTKSERARLVWEQWAKKLSGVSAACLAAFLLSPAPSDAAPLDGSRCVTSMYYVKRWFHIAARIFGAARLPALPARQAFPYAG